MIRPIIAAWNHLFFSTTERHPLGVMRIAYVLFEATVRLPMLLREPAHFMRTDIDLLTPNVGWTWSPLPVPIPPEHLPSFELGVYALAACATLGLGTRLSLGLLTVVYWYLGGLNSAGGLFNHVPSMSAQLLLILCVAPGTTAWSLDRVAQWWWRGRARGQAFRAFVAHRHVPRWGFVLILLLFSAIYVSAGVSKLTQAGPRWLDGQTLSYYLDKRNSNVAQRFGSNGRVPEHERWKDGVGLEFYTYTASPGATAQWISRSPILSAASSVAAVAIELAFPLVLLGRRWRTAMLSAAIAMHVGIYFLMKILFLPYIVALTLLFDWPALPEWWRRWRASRVKL